MSFYKMRTKDGLGSCSAFLVIAFLLLFTTLTQNQLLSLQQQSSLIPSLAYADKIKLANSLVNQHHHRQHQYEQQQQRQLLPQPPLLSFGNGNDNDDDGIGITEFTLPANNKIIVP